MKRQRWDGDRQIYGWIRNPWKKTRLSDNCVRYWMWVEKKQCFQSNLKFRKFPKFFLPLFVSPSPFQCTIPISMILISMAFDMYQCNGNQQQSFRIKLTDFAGLKYLYLFGYKQAVSIGFGNFLNCTILRVYVAQSLQRNECNGTYQFHILAQMPRDTQLSHDQRSMVWR